MTRNEHLYIIAAEECSELAQRCSKSLRFGGNEIQPGQPLDNRYRMLEEFADLIAVMQMLGLASDVVPTGSALRYLVDLKKKKVEEFLRYSEECGTLMGNGQ